MQQASGSNISPTVKPWPSRRIPRPAYLRATVDETLVASTTNLRIGCLTTDAQYFDGALDEVRIWGAELDQSTIQTYMNWFVGAGHPAYGSLEGYWRFDEGGGQIAASEVGGSQGEAGLGETVGTDTSGPTWVSSDVTPVEKRSYSWLKALYVK